MCPLEFTQKKKMIRFLAIKALTIRCRMFPAERKRKKPKKLEYKKPHKNTTKTNIKTHQEYKRGALTK